MFYWRRVGRRGALIPGLFALATGLTIPDHAFSQDSAVVAFQIGMQLGRGYDTVTGTPKEKCVTFEPLPVTTQALALVDYSLEVISSSQNLVNATHIQTAASVNLAVFSSSAAMDYASNHKVNTFDAAALARVAVGLQWHSANLLGLLPGLAELAASDPVAFRQRCGDRWVSDVLPGGLLLSTLQSETQNQDDEDKANAKIEASAAVFKASGTIDHAALETLNQLHTTTTGKIIGGSTHPAPGTPDELTTRASNFPAEVQQTGGTELFATLQEYPLPTPVSVPPHVPTVLARIANLYWDLASVLADLDYIDHHPLQFDMDPAGWQQHLHDLRQSAEAGQDQLAAAAADCRNDLTHCGVPNVVDPGSLRDQYPLRYSGTCDTVNFTPQPLAVFPLGQHVRGDKDIDGHDPEIRVSAQTQVDQQGYVINATARVSIQEDQPDYTTFEDERVGQLLDLRFVQLHCFVDSNGVNPSTGELVARGQNDNHNWTVYGPGQGSTGDTGTGLLEAAECISDTNGNDDGKLGCRNIVLRPVQLSLRHDEKRMDDTIRRFTLSQRRQAAENISSNAEGNAAAAYGRLLDSAIKAAEAQGASQLLSWLRTQTRGGPITNSGQPRIPVPMTPRSDRPARLLHQ